MNIDKVKEICERKSKEVEKLNNDVTILRVKLSEKDQRIDSLKDENLKIFE